MHRRGQRQLVEIEDQRGRADHQIGQDVVPRLVHRHHVFAGVRDLLLELAQLVEGDRAADRELAPLDQRQDEALEEEIELAAGHRYSPFGGRKPHSAKRPTGSLTTAGSPGGSTRASSTSAAATSTRASARRSSATSAWSCTWKG